MKYEVKPTSKFQRDIKRAERRGCDMSLMTNVIKMLAAGEMLPKKFKDHDLSGDYVGCRECHITPDWLLIYRISQEKLILVLSRTGTHSDLF